MEWDESRPTPASGGHIFIIDGDLQQLACDAWLLPTDQKFSITSSFCSALGREQAFHLDGVSTPWTDGCIHLEHANGEGRPDLWLGDIGRHSLADFSHYQQRAWSFVRQASEAARSRVSGRPPLLAIGAVGTGRGGQRSNRKGLLTALLPTLLNAACAFECDVVLVTYGQVMYGMAQRVRRELTIDDPRYWEALPEGLRSSAEEQATLAKEGRLVTFFGAGVGADVGRPTWQELLEDVARNIPEFDISTLGSLAGMDPRDQATVLQSLGGPTFKQTVARVLAAERYSLSHGLLASLPVTESVTTNFDDLYERAARISGRTLNVFPGDNLAASPRWLLKLHGTIGEDLVLTRDEYLGAMTNHVALRGLVQAMLVTRRMLFVGYGLRDEDFHQLVHEVRGAVGGVTRSGSGSAALVPDVRQRMGTVLTLQRVPHLDLLWPELDIVSMALEGESITDRLAARRLTIYLDHVGSLAASDAVYVASDDLGELSSEEEFALAGLVARLAHLAATRTGSGVRWADVDAFLAKFTGSH